MASSTGAVTAASGRTMRRCGLPDRPRNMADGQAVGVLFSGGLDSSVALYLCRNWGLKVAAIEVDHSSRPDGERMAAARIAKLGRFRHHRVLLDCALFRRSGRDPSYMALVGVAEHVCSSAGLMVLVVASLQEDCCGGTASQSSPYYLSTLNSLLRLHGKHHVRILTPFAAADKREVVQLGRSLRVPLEASWSCTRDGSRPCRRCRACHERRVALKKPGSRFVNSRSCDE